jgi:hypothetical protein
MKPIALLGRPPDSRVKTATMYGYIFLDVILLVLFKAVRLTGGF